MKKPIVSVVMPARDAEATLEEALESIQEQDLQHFEIVLVDHHSVDSTPSIIHRAARGDQRIRHFRSEGSFVEAANLAWKQAKGEWIARMDSDDVAHPSRLSHQISFLNEHPDLDACGTLVRIQKRGSEQGEIIPADGGYARDESWVNSVITKEEIAAQRFVDSPVPNPTAMIRKTTLEKLGGYHDPSWAEDYDFWLRFLEAGYCVAKVPETLLDWYDSPNRSTRTIERYEQDQFQQAKAAFLSRLDLIQTSGVVIWGAGPIGKQMARLVGRNNVPVHAFIDIDDRKIGNQINGIQVLDPLQWRASAPSTVLLSAVGNSNARSEIRKFVTPLGYEEGENFFCVA